jgi:tetratricopeptide (TPR) repeat protein
MKLGLRANGGIWFEHAAVLLLSGDETGYRKAFVYMVEVAQKSRLVRGYHLARALTLSPGTIKLALEIGKLVDRELKGAGDQFWSLTEQAALRYRTGRFEEAVDLLHQSLRADGWPGNAVLNWLWLALAHQRLGETREARKWLDRAARWLDQFANGLPTHAETGLRLHPHNWLEAHILRREAETLLKVPAAPRK